jgi:hypothetical protein
MSSLEKINVKADKAQNNRSVTFCKLYAYYPRGVYEPVISRFSIGTYT